MRRRGLLGYRRQWLRVWRRQTRDLHQRHQRARGAGWGWVRRARAHAGAAEEPALRAPCPPPRHRGKRGRERRLACVIWWAFGLQCKAKRGSVPLSPASTEGPRSQTAANGARGVYGVGKGEAPTCMCDLGGSLVSINGYDGVSICTGGNTRTERFRVDTDGNVGIGNTSPNTKLDVNGDITGDTIFVGGSTTRGIRPVSGNYGTVQTTGDGAGGWEGYSINGRYVFMSSDNSSCGIFNDLDNKWMAVFYRNGAAKLYHDGNEKSRQQARVSK